MTRWAKKIQHVQNPPSASSLDINGLGSFGNFDSHLSAISLRCVKKYTFLKQNLCCVLYISLSQGIALENFRWSWWYFELFSSSLVYCWGWTNKIWGAVRRTSCNGLQVLSKTVTSWFWREGDLALDHSHPLPGGDPERQQNGAHCISEGPGSSEVSHEWAGGRLGKVAGHYWQWCDITLCTVPFSSEFPLRHGITMSKLTNTFSFCRELHVWVSNFPIVIQTH